MWCLNSLLNHLKEGFFFFFFFCFWASVAPCPSSSSMDFADRSESDWLFSCDDELLPEARLLPKALEPPLGVSEGLLFWVLAV
mmetsp:Transcript_35011/g.75826  ORF Transcript_35011/g.75826 Transcript_35011/m.75826 type:complete len:83 (-) Transcript_35011:453-701(-)